MESTTGKTNPLWWARDQLNYRADLLHMSGQNLESLAAEAGTPLFVYDAGRVAANLERLHTNLERHGVPYQIFFALKSNRFLPLLTFLRLNGRCGVDVSSPGELRLARQIGFQPEEIVYTNTAVSNDDIEWLARHPQVHVNCDSLSSLRRLAKRCPGRPLGLRINPQRALAYNEQLAYAGSQATKFGIYPDRVEEAVSLAAELGSPVKTLHFHLGTGYMTPDLEGLDEVITAIHPLAMMCPDLQAIDIGGGLGVRMKPEDPGLDLDAWAGLLARHAKTLGVTIQIEPGDYLVKDAGLLLVEVNTVEEKGGTLFVGVNAGLNLQGLFAYYRLPFAFAPARQRPGRPEIMTIAGHINEGIDIFGRDVELVRPSEGDLLAILNAGGYGASMSSNHCLRGQFSEYIIWPL